MFALLGVILVGSVVGLLGSVAHPCLGVVFPYGWVSLILFAFSLSPVFRCIPFTGISVPLGSRFSACVMCMLSELAQALPAHFWGGLCLGYEEVSLFLRAALFRAFQFLLELGFLLLLSCSYVLV